MICRVRLELVSIVWALALILVGCAGQPAPPTPDEEAYVDSVEAFRAEREERLRGENGWLSLAGLFWLEEGENRFGTDPSGRVVFPEGTAPAYAGSIFLEGGGARIEVTEGVHQWSLHFDDTRAPAKGLPVVGMRPGRRHANTASSAP